MEDTEEIIAERSDSLVDDHDRLLRTLVEHRREHHLSQETVAERMGVSQPTVAAFERYDANPTLSTIRRYALAVGVRLHTQVMDDCVQHRRRPEPVLWMMALNHVERRLTAPTRQEPPSRHIRRTQRPQNLDVLPSIGAYTISRLSK